MHGRADGILIDQQQDQILDAGVERSPRNAHLPPSRAVNERRGFVDATDQRGSPCLAASDVQDHQVLYT